MPFGKRALPVSTPPVSANLAPSQVPPVQLPSADRHRAMKEIMLRIFADAAPVAEAVRSNGAIMLTGVAEEVDPATAPIELRDLKEQFTFIDNGTVMHPFYCYQSTEPPGHVDPSAQFQIYELVCAARDLNVFCQEAQQDGALGIALQTPRLPGLVDQIIVSATYFAAYFDCLAHTHNLSQANAHGQRAHDAAAHQLTFERHKLMATDKMVVPDTYTKRVPNASRQIIGVELVRPQESSESFIHGIYFPAEYATRLAASARKSRLEALRARN